MMSNYRLIQYCPDPASAEVINVGAVIFGDHGPYIVETQDWHRVREFGCPDVELLRETIRDLHDLSADELWAIDWEHGVRFSKPAASMLPPEELRTYVCSRLLRCTKTLWISKPDLEGLRLQPAYVTHQLVNCAPDVIARPRFVFAGLRGSSPHLSQGRAYAGKPQHRYDNKGRPAAAPDQKVFVVYTDAEDSVFDWDWVDSDQDGRPINARERYREEIEAPVPAELVGMEDVSPGILDTTRAVYSRRGDCIFYYWQRDPSYARRLDEYITLFCSFSNDRVVGMKLKNVADIARVVIEKSPHLMLQTAEVHRLTTLSLGLSAEEAAHEHLMRRITKVKDAMIVERGDRVKWRDFSETNGHPANA